MMDNATQKHNIPLVKKSYLIYERMRSIYYERSYVDNKRLFDCSTRTWEEQTGKSFELLLRSVNGIRLIPDKATPLLFSGPQPLPKERAETKSVQEQLLRAIDNSDACDYFVALSNGAQNFPNTKELEVILKENRTRELPFYRIIQKGGTAAMLEKTTLHDGAMGHHIWELMLAERFWHHKMEEISLWKVLDCLNTALKSVDLEEYDAAKELWEELSTRYNEYCTKYRIPEGSSNPISCDQIMQAWSQKNSLQAKELLNMRPSMQNIVLPTDLLKGIGIGKKA